MRTLYASIISVGTATLAAAFFGLISIPIQVALFEGGMNGSHTDDIRQMAAFAAFGIPTALLCSLVGVSILWLVIWMPTYCFRHRFPFFWKPWIATSSGGLLGVLLVLLGESSVNAGQPGGIFNCFYIAALFGGAVLFYLGSRFSKSTS